MSEPLLPIAAAQYVAKKYHLAQVILFGWDGKMTHVVTYGKTLEDCEQAAAGANSIQDKWNWPEGLRAVPDRIGQIKVDAAAKALRKVADALMAGPHVTITHREVAELLRGCALEEESKLPA